MIYSLIHTNVIGREIVVNCHDAAGRCDCFGDTEVPKDIRLQVRAIYADESRSPADLKLNATGQSHVPQHIAAGPVPFA